VEHLFLNSEGFAILLDDLHPWTVEFLANVEKFTSTGTQVIPLNQICLGLEDQPQDAHRADPEHSLEFYSMKFRVFVGETIRAVHSSVMLKYFTPKANKFSGQMAPVLQMFGAAFFPTESCIQIGSITQSTCVIATESIDSKLRDISVSEVGEHFIDDWCNLMKINQLTALQLPEILVKSMLVPVKDVLQYYNISDPIMRKYPNFSQLDTQNWLYRHWKRLTRKSANRTNS